MTTPPQSRTRAPWNLLGWLVVALIVAAIVVTVLMIVGTTTIAPQR